MKNLLNILMVFGVLMSSADTNGMNPTIPMPDGTRKSVNKIVADGTGSFAYVWDEVRQFPAGSAVIKVNEWTSMTAGNIHSTTLCTLFLDPRGNLGRFITCMSSMEHIPDQYILRTGLGLPQDEREGIMQLLSSGERQLVFSSMPDETGTFTCSFQYNIRNCIRFWVPTQFEIEAMI